MKLLIGFFFKVFSFFISLLPTRARNAIGDLVGLIWFDVLRIRRQVALDNVAIAFPDKSPEERLRIARLSLCHMGRTLLDFAVFPFLRRETIDRHYRIEGREHVDKALAEGKGVFLLTLHLGNGDFAVAILSLLGWPMNLISKEFKSRWLNDLWFGMRQRHGTKFIAPEKSSFEILRCLRRNEVVVFVLDQFMGPPVGVRTRFFGKETGTAAGLALLASRTGTPVVPCYTFRQPDGYQVAVFEEPIQLDDGPSAKDITVMTQRYTDKLEAIVRRHPEQWMWIHRRWKEFRE